MKRKHVFKVLDTNGDGTGEKIATGDYSATPTGFKFKVLEPETVVIYRMIVKIQDSGAFDADKYGNNITLTNGIRVYHKNAAGEILEEITAYPIMSSGDWAGHCHDAVLHSFGIGDEVLSIRWTFAKSGLPLILKFSDNEYFEVLLNDDFSNLVDHRFIIQGHFSDEDLV